MESVDVSERSSSQLTTSTGSLIDLESIAVVTRGCIEGANFVIASPRDGAPPGQCLLIHCHGFRPEGTPPFAEVDDLFWFRLIQQGWTVAVTSYRRAGLIVADAIRDVLNLHCYVCKEMSIPSFCFLDGRSMGGAISTRLAEQVNIKRVIHGVMAIGAALLVKEDDPKLQLTYRPTIPIVYLTNTSEVGPIEAYIEQVKKNAQLDHQQGVMGGDEVITPALHHVDREGHNWTNARERWRAFSSLVEWTMVGSLVTEFRSDATRQGVAPSHQCHRQHGWKKNNNDNNNNNNDDNDDHDYLCARIEQCEDRTSFRTNLTLLDLHECHIRINTVLKARLENGTEFSVHLGAYPFVGVRDDSVVLSEDPENYLCLFAMSEFRNRPATAILELGLKVGDKIWFQIPEEKPKRGARRLQMPPPIDL